MKKSFGEKRPNVRNVFITAQKAPDPILLTRQRYGRKLVIVAVTLSGRN